MYQYSSGGGFALSVVKDLQRFPAQCTFTTDAHSDNDIRCVEGHEHRG